MPPAVIHFTSSLMTNDAARKDAARYLPVPDEVASIYISAGWERVEGLAAGHPFRAQLIALEGSALGIQVTEAMLRATELSPDTAASITLLGPEPEPQLPAELHTALQAAPAAAAVWHELNIHNRLDWIRWIEGARQAATRARRIERTVDQLSEGKRRACCVNVYEYMQNLIASETQQH
ncbi:MAG: YdeI/OmpD-associated family protein [bacterium]